MAAANIEEPDSLKLLLKGGADVNAKAGNGETVLMWAATRNGNPDAVSILLKAGADINAKSGEGKTALDLAREMDNVEVAKVLKAARQGRKK